MSVPAAPKTAQVRRGDRLPGPQQVTVINAVRAQHPRRDQRHDLAPRARGARPIAEVHGFIHRRLDPEPAGEHGGHHHARVGDRSLIVKHDTRGVRQTLHHVGDLLVQARRRRNRQLSACS
ncbi:MAG: hypothetical protein ACRDK8_15980 [Solirubrobacteraceae bacterium]